MKRLIKGHLWKVNEFIQQLTAECAGGHVQFNNETEEWCSIIHKDWRRSLEKTMENVNYL